MLHGSWMDRPLLKVASVALSEIDRNLLQRCLARQPRAWEGFVDRFLGLVVHVINHTAQCRSMQLSEPDREDLCAEVFLTILDKDYAVLRHFRGESSLATYLTVIARRVVTKELSSRHSTASLEAAAAVPDRGNAEQRIEDRDEVERLMSGLNPKEAEVIRMYHLEGRSYREISDSAGVPENSVGPTLNRARRKLRESGARL